MIFKPAICRDRERGPTTILILLAASFLLALMLLWLPIDAAAFVILVLLLILLGLAGYVTWRTWACLSLVYRIDRNAVTIHWGPVSQVIPLSAIRRIVRRGPEAPAGEPGPFPWLNRWPRVARRLVISPELDRTHQVNGTRITSLAARPLQEQILLETASGAFGVSPADPVQFIHNLEQHNRLGPTQVLQLERRLPGLLRIPAWQDNLGRKLLAAGLPGSLIILGLVMARYPWLVRSDADSALFWLPAFAVGVWIINGLWGLSVHSQHRLVALLLWGGALVVHGAMLIALLSLAG